MLFLATVLFLVATSSGDVLISLQHDDASLRIDNDSGVLSLSLSQGGEEKLSGELRVSSQDAINPCLGLENCLNFGESRLHVYPSVRNGFTLLWSSLNTDQTFLDCFALNRGSVNWFGGPERWSQYWPIEKLELTNFPNVPQENGFGAIVEPYWLNSRGAYVFVDEKVPLFIYQNSLRDDAVCFNARAEAPFATPRPRVLLNYTIAALDDARQAHLHAVAYFLGRPSGLPAFKVIERPIWSTWARYKKDIDDQVLREFANEIVDYGFSDGQFEIDDFWETCYGSLTFRSPEFDDIDETVRLIKEMGFRVALWTHPFINKDCDYSEIATENNFLIRSLDGSLSTSWWNSGTNEAHHVDFTNAEARDWFSNRLRLLQQNHGIDTFKFDAGETSWAPQVPHLFGDVEKSPSSMTAAYVRACAEFGGYIEVRSGWGTQDLPVLVRMIDKDSRWGLDNGLHALLTSTLQMNMNGYTLVLPDMIGGNGYVEIPTSELFVRWLQTNIFMPTIQFSFVPWDFLTDDFDIVQISLDFVALHASFAPEIVRVMERSIVDGYPVNPPIWWIDPTNPDALGVDDQYLLGEDILVAPVIWEGATSRDVYLPSGTWIDGNTADVYNGGVLLNDYPAPIEVLPYFIRSGSNAERIHKELMSKKRLK